jgi:glycyl-tRNA synthetase beta subunit
MAEFLFEIGLEEVPARMVAGAQAELQRRVLALLERERLVHGGWRCGWARLRSDSKMWRRNCRDRR